MNGEKAKELRHAAEVAKKLAQRFEGVDTRSQRRIKYPIEIIIFLVLLMFAMNDFGWSAYKQVIIHYSDYLCKELEIDKLPSMFTIRRVCILIDSQKLSECMMNWVATCGKIPDLSTIAIDGKHIRSAFKECKGSNSIHVVSAFSTALKMTLSQITTTTKEAEITIIPKLLKLIDINNRIITIDAAGSYKQIINVIVERNGHYILAVKKNQLSSYNAVVELFNKRLHILYAKPSEIRKTKDKYPGHWHQTLDRGHGRIEIRRVIQFSIDDIADPDIIAKWPNAKTIICVESERQKVNSPIYCCERRYYITDLPIDPKRVGEAIRAHWGIEMMHWQLDVTFLEDLSLIRDNNAIKNLGMFRRYILNTYSQYTDNETYIPKLIRNFIHSKDNEFRYNIILGVGPK